LVRERPLALLRRALDGLGLAFTDADDPSPPETGKPGLEVRAVVDAVDRLSWPFGLASTWWGRPTSPMRKVVRVGRLLGRAAGGGSIALPTLSFHAGRDRLGPFAGSSAAGRRWLATFEG